MSIRVFNTAVTNESTPKGIQGEVVVTMEMTATREVNQISNTKQDGHTSDLITKIPLKGWITRR